MMIPDLIWRRIMARHLIAAPVIGLLLTAGIVVFGFSGPSFAADDPPPPPPIDWSDFIDSLSKTPKDFVVGEEMC